MFTRDMMTQDEQEVINLGINPTLTRKGRQMYRECDVSLAMALKGTFSKAKHDLTEPAAELRDAIDLVHNMLSVLSVSATKLDVTRYRKDMGSATAQAVDLAAQLPQLRDIRKFFLADGGQRSVKRLLDMVAALESLKAMKASGVLGIIVGTNKENKHG